MSFFFNKKKQEQKLKPVTAPPAGTKALKQALNRLGCKGCPLNSVDNITPKMEPVHFGDKCEIYILSGQPTQKDDENGKHFTGKSEGILREILGSYNDYSLDSVVRDFNGNGYDPRQRRQGANFTAMECCRSLVEKSIASERPRVVIGLGNLPLQWMLGSSDMVGLRGRLFSVQINGHPCYFIPTYHPSDVIEKAFDPRNPLRSKFGHCLKFDIKRAIEATKLAPPAIDTPQAVRAAIQTFNGKTIDQCPDLLKLIGEAAKAPTKAIDLETSHLRPYATGAKVLTCAISYDDTNFAFAIDHKNAGWTSGQRTMIVLALRNLLLSEGRIVAHNAPFEVEWLIHLLSKSCIVQDLWECTMMQAHFIDERRGKRGGNDEQYAPNPYQALDFLTKQYFGLAYKSVFKLNRKDMANADLDETLLYNGADTKYTLRLYAAQTNYLKGSGLYHAYLEASKRQPTVAIMQSIGIDISQIENKRFQKRLAKEISAIEAEIFQYQEVKDYIKDWKQFNPASGIDVLKLFKDYLKVGEVILNETGKESTDKSVLSQIPHPFAKSLDNFRNRTKLKSTYIDCFEEGRGQLVWPDGRIHPAFNTTFAETGRTSSDEPNQQNWPSRRDKWVRRQVVAPAGHVLVAFDYGQLEACTAAMCTQDKVLIDALCTDYDIHMEWAKKAAYIYPTFVGGKANIDDPKIMKEFRSLIKNKLVFPVIFGASTKSVGGYLRLATQTETPQHKVDKLMEEFWETFHETATWHKELMNGYYARGYVSSPTGRRRHYPLTKNQAINYPIQSVACDIVCRGMVSLSTMASDTAKWYLHPIMNIHDDLTFCIPDSPGILDEAIETIYRAMLDPGFDFINVPLSVSCSVGKNWLDMEEVGKFWSHKDL